MTYLALTDHGMPATGSVATATPSGPGGLEEQLERHRAELTACCYRMLGSVSEAEDAVQETFVRAWRALGHFDGDVAALRPWLYRIATNVCLTLLSRRRRHPQPVDLGPTWPARDASALADGPTATDDPAERVVARETIRLAFVVALRHLAPRLCAVLILRDVLSWRAREVADALDTTPMWVHGALRRARAVLATVDVDPGAGRPIEPDDQEQRELLDRYVTAFERCDLQTLITLLCASGRAGRPRAAERSPNVGQRDLVA